MTRMNPFFPIPQTPDRIRQNNKQTFNFLETTHA
ncbi:MAG: hypothetical protein JWR68_3063 [Polaromonas sp.]|nr:hypothetical protein [Polaromonas sp.]